MQQRLAVLEKDRDEHRRGGRDPDAAMSTLLVRNSNTQRGTTGAGIENVLDHDLNEKGWRRQLLHQTSGAVVQNVM
jgi:hypothetical protein